MVPNQPNDTPEPRVEIPLIPSVFPSTLFPAPLIPGSSTLGVRACSDPECNERILNIDTPRVGSDNNWIQVGPTSNPSDFKFPYARDLDGNGYTEYGMQVNVTPGVLGVGVEAVGIIAGAALASTGVGVVPGAAIAIGSIGMGELWKTMNLHYALGFNVEPGPAIEKVQETASNAWEEVQDTESSLRQKAKDYVRDVWDRNNDGVVVPPRDDETGRIFRSKVGQTLGMRRLNEAYARLQSLA